jgi:hypothetical protein
MAVSEQRACSARQNLQLPRLVGAAGSGTKLACKLSAQTNQSAGWRSCALAQGGVPQSWQRCTFGFPESSSHHRKSQPI